MNDLFIDVEERKNNLYYDETGLQILPGDLLRVYHFTSGKTKRYMYHVADIEDGQFPVMVAHHYRRERPHYRLYIVADERRIIHGTRIIHKFDLENERKRINRREPS